MWKITLVGNQKPENTQVKVLLFQLRFAQGVGLTFSHFTVGIMQVSVAGCNVRYQDSGHQHTCCLSALGDRRIRNLNFEFSVKEETPKYFVDASAVKLQHMLPSSLLFAPQMKLHNTPEIGKT